MKLWKLWNELTLMAYISCEFSLKVSTWFTDTLKNRLAIKYLCGHSNNVLWNHYCLWEAMFVAFVGNPCICIYFSTNVYSNTCWVFVFFYKIELATDDITPPRTRTILATKEHWPHKFIYVNMRGLNSKKR